MRNTKAAAEAVRTALGSARYEVLPTAKIEAAILESVPSDIPLTITASPAKGLNATLELTEKLVGHG